MNAIAWLEFELTYNDVVVQHISYNIREIPSWSYKWYVILLKSLVIL